MKTKLLLLIRLLLISVGVCAAQTKQELAYDVIGAQMHLTHYLMDLSARGGEEDQATVDILQYQVDKACYDLIGRHNIRRCEIAVCYHTGVPFKSCTYGRGHR